MFDQNKSLATNFYSYPFHLVEDMEMRSTTDLIAAAAADVETDDFEKLKAEREKERLERTKQKIARTISTAPGNDNIVPVVAAAIVPATSGSCAATPVSLLPPGVSNADLLSITEPVTNSTVKTNEDPNE